MYIGNRITYIIDMSDFKDGMEIAAADVFKKFAVNDEAGKPKIFSKRHWNLLCRVFHVYKNLSGAKHKELFTDHLIKFVGCSRNQWYRFTQEYYGTSPYFREILKIAFLAEFNPEGAISNPIEGITYEGDPDNPEWE